MKQLLLTSFITVSLIASTGLFASESLSQLAPAKQTLDKARIKAEQSTLVKGQITYVGNVSYTHANMNLTADKLTRLNDERKKVTITGNPIKVIHQDLNGQQTIIYAPQIDYWEDTGEIIASGSINIEQATQREKLTLSGNHLKANRRQTSGFSFVLSGKPTQFRLQQIGQELIQATANQLSSNGRGRKTQLTGNVKLSQGSASMAAAAMIYDAQKETITAEQGVDGEQRVETEFFWEKESAEKTNNKDSD